MKEKTKKILKATGIVIGSSIGLVIVGFAYIGAGNTFAEQYHDPEHFMNSMLQCARYGWSLKLNDGWAA